MLATDTLTLKCSSNEEVLGHIKSLFDVTLRDEAFIDKNEKENFTDKPYQKLDTSIGWKSDEKAKKRMEKYERQNQAWHQEKSLTGIFILIQC